MGLLLEDFSGCRTWYLRFERVGSGLELVGVLI